MEKHTVQCFNCSHRFDIDLKSKTLTQVTTCPKCSNKFTFDPSKKQEIVEKKVESPELKSLICPSCSKIFKVRPPSFHAEHIFTTCPSCNLRFDIYDQIFKSVQEPPPPPEPPFFERFEIISQHKKVEEEIIKADYKPKFVPTPERDEIKEFEPDDHIIPKESDVHHEDLEKDKIHWHDDVEEDELLLHDEIDDGGDELNWDVEQKKDKISLPDDIEEGQKEVHRHELIKKEEFIEDSKKDREEIHWHDEIIKAPSTRPPPPPPLPPPPKKYKKPSKEFGSKISEAIKKPLQSLKNFDIHKEIFLIKESLNPKNLSTNFKTRSGKAGFLLLIVFLLGIIFGIYSILDVNSTDSYEESSLKSSSIAGKVLDKNGDPINDVHITVIGKTKEFKETTNQDGWYRVEDLPTGIYTIIAKKTDYGTVTQKYFKVKPTESTQNVPVFELGSNDKTIELKQEEGLTTNSMICVVFYFIFSIFALLGGILALERKSFKLCGICAAFGVLTIGFFIGAILGIIALILILSSKEDFR